MRRRPCFSLRRRRHSSKEQFEACSTSRYANLQRQEEHGSPSLSSLDSKRSLKSSTVIRTLFSKLRRPVVKAMKTLSIGAEMQMAPRLSGLLPAFAKFATLSTEWPYDKWSKWTSLDLDDRFSSHTSAALSGTVIFIVVIVELRSSQDKTRILGIERGSNFLSNHTRFSVNPSREYNVDL